MKLALAHPNALWLLLLLPCFFRCYRARLALYFLRIDLLPKLSFGSFAAPLAYVMLVIALAAPFSYSALELGERKGRDLALVIDASGSMEESFGQKSKFELVKQMATNFFKERFDDNIAVVVFGSFAYIAAPLTYDTKALSFVIRYLKPSIAGNNTAIGEGIYEALKALQKGKAKHKVIILISDGHHNSGRISPKEAVELAKKQKVRIYTIGLGDVDKKLMRKIAGKSGGSFFYAKTPEDLQAIFQRLDRLEPSPIRSGHYSDRHWLFYPFLLAAFALFVWILWRQR